MGSSMKSHAPTCPGLSMQTIRKLSATMMLAVSIAGLALAQRVEGAVTWLASDDGANLTLTTTGTFNMGTASAEGTGSVGGAAWAADTTSSRFGNGTVYYLTNAGTLGADPWIAGNLNQSGSGHAFGYIASSMFIWDLSLGATPGIFTPVTTMTFTGLTVATAFGTNLDAGPVTIWTFGLTGDTISVSGAVPEPTSSVMVALGVAGLMVRRRRGTATFRSA